MAGRIGPSGRRVQAGELLDLTAEEARYEAVVPEHGNSPSEKPVAKRRAEATSS